MQNKLVIIAFLFISMFSYSQDQYIVVSFESNYIHSEVLKNYFWIVPVDSIKDRDFYLYPLYLIVGEYSKDNLDDCIRGDTIDIFISTRSTNVDFGNQYEKEVESFYKLVMKNRIKVQSINANWMLNKKAKIKINVYITPVSGNFCKCYHHGRNYSDGFWLDGFMSYIYLPISNFTYNESFWHSPIANIAKFSNYLFIDFMSHLNYLKGVQTISK